jgi:membrane protein
MNLKGLWGLLKETVQDWSEDKASRLAAALAYFTIFSLAPLLVIVIAIAGLVFGREAAQNQLSGQIQDLVGQQGAGMIQTMIQNTSKPSTSIIATIIGVITLLLGASGVFGALQDALNTIWEVAPNPKAGLMAMLRNRFVSFGMILVVGFLLLVSLLLTAVLAAVGKFMGGFFPSAVLLGHVINFVVSFGGITLLFALIYKVLPDAKIAWGDVWIGAAVTSLLFTIGRLLIGLYLGRGSVGSAYGAAGSLIVLLVWTYYSAMILFLGAEFTKVYAYKYGSHIEPAENAVPVTQEALAQQGTPTRERLDEAVRRQGQPAQQRVGFQESTGDLGPDVRQGQQTGDRRASDAKAGAMPGGPAGRPAIVRGAGIGSEAQTAKPASGFKPLALGVAAFLLATLAFGAGRPGGRR